MTNIQDQITWQPPRIETPASWPDGNTMSVSCPHCGADNQVQIAVVRDWGDDVRPADCDTCLGDFELAHDGSVRKLRLVSGKFGWEMEYDDPK
jgi:hypothetical protein